MVEHLDDPKIAKNFQTLIVNLDDTVREFGEVVERLQDLNLQRNPKYEVDFQVLDAFEDLVCHVRHASLSCGPPSRASASEGANDSVPLAQLPKIDLPSFSGDPLKWPVFFDTFSSLIHQNTRLDNTAKIHYLLGCLKGRALETCSGISPTAANYSILWDMLVRKFQNPRLLADAHFRRLLDFKPLTTESAEGLDSLVDQVFSSYQALQQLRLPDLADFFAAHLTLSKLDPVTRKTFEQSEHAPIPTMKEVMGFIRHQVEALRHLKGFNPPKGHASTSQTSGRNPRVLVVSDPANKTDSSPKMRPCPLCRAAHSVYVCPSLAKGSNEERWSLVRKHKLCVNCLSDGHLVAACKSTNNCRVCSKRHHTRLHPPVKTGGENAESSEKTATIRTPLPSPEVATSHLCSKAECPRTSRSTAVLPTAVISIKTPAGDFPARFLIDSGSQVHIITLQCCRRMRLAVKKGVHSLNGIGGVSEPVRGQAEFVICSRLEPTAHYEISALVLQRITSQMPPTRLCSSVREQFGKLPLADADFDRPGEVDGVLGAELFAQILQPAFPLHSESGVSAIPTKLGYVLMGAAKMCTESAPTLPPKINLLCTLDTLVRKFWELEEVAAPERGNPMDECETLFAKTTTRSPEGRYCVHLPFAESPSALGDSFIIAKKRLLSLEKTLNKSPQLKAQYEEVLQDYLRQGHASLVSHPETLAYSYFIPHFAVFKESSSTPVRIVFDASCKTTTGKSLNDVLLTGPKLQTDIQDVLLRFRRHPIAVVADIRQMYRNILVTPAHRRYQRFLWRTDENSNLQILELNCVPFGLSPAPFLALRTVRQLAADEKAAYPLAARIAETDMYVDDVVTSVTEEEAPLLYSQLVGFFRAGGFQLTKWTTNSPIVAKSIPDQDQVIPAKALDRPMEGSPAVKVLGLNWDAATDSFFFSVHPQNPCGTKRNILSTLAKIWDPLGFLAPATFLCKVLIKRLWLSNCGWDDSPPDALARLWSRIYEELPALKRFIIPRHPGNVYHRTTLLLGFCDSSEAGYGAAIYLIAPSSSGEFSSTLLVAKTKVSPMAPCSIPRLELCAAVLLSKLFRLVRASYAHIPDENILALSDSEDVLHWLARSPSHWKTFVANRVSAIHEVLPETHWFHVPGRENIADGASRGLTPLQLLNHPSWVTGPPWIVQPRDLWPLRKISKFSRDPLERKSLLVAALHTNSCPIYNLIERFSSFSKLCNTVVYVLRFMKRLPRRERILASDLAAAELQLVRAVQREHFASEFTLLREQKLPTKALRHLKPFIENDCLRVRGRLENAQLPYTQQHPLLLPKKAHMVEILVDYYHRLYLHAGPNLLLSLIRQKFWILSARGVIRQRVHRCIRCFRNRPKTAPPLMAPLPAARVTATRPFAVCGVDYAGPFNVTVGRYRGVRSQKAYICIFVCFATKAVHLELASNLTTDAFLKCFVRFISRRGPISMIYSDCGTNFVGAKAQVELHDELTRSKSYRTALGNALATHRIEWRLNPPSAPHFRGLWEAGVKSVKNHLFRVVGTQILSWEEFYTLLTQIESILNSRPLCSLSADPSEPEALTPAHFLSLTPLRCLPLVEPHDSETHLPARKALVDHMVREFWRRWQREYLTSLQPRKKWDRPSEALTVGTVVVVREDNAPPLHWPLGVIEEVYPGADGVARVALVRVGGTSLRRPTVKLAPLPNQ